MVHSPSQRSEDFPHTASITLAEDIEDATGVIEEQTQEVDNYYCFLTQSQGDDGYNDMDTEQWLQVIKENNRFAEKREKLRVRKRLWGIV